MLLFDCLVNVCSDSQQLWFSVMYNKTFLKGWNYTMMKWCQLQWTHGLKRWNCLRTLQSTRWQFSVVVAVSSDRGCLSWMFNHMPILFFTAFLGPPSAVSVTPVNGLLQIAITDPLSNTNGSMKQWLPKMYYLIQYWGKKSKTQVGAKHVGLSIQSLPSCIFFAMSETQESITYIAI